MNRRKPNRQALANLPPRGVAQVARMRITFAQSANGRAWVEQAEGAYTRFVANWQIKPGQRTGATNRKRPS